MEHFGGGNPLAGMSGDQKAKMMEKLKAQFGDQVPGGLGGLGDLKNMSPEKKQKLLHSEMGQ